jgi:hypothetical protein
VTKGNIAELANCLYRATRCFCCRFEQWDTKENSAVAEEPSSEPTAKNYGVRGESRNVAEIFDGFAVDSNKWILGRAVA